MYRVLFDREKTYRTARAGDLGAGMTQKLFFSKALFTWLSRQLMIPRVALSALLASYRANHGTGTGFLASNTGR
jgi:hypothetical protein